MSIALPAVLTMAEARATVAGLVERIASEEPVLDASPLQALDTAALAVLLECRRVALGAGKTLRVTGAPPKLEQLARLYGVDELLAL